MQKVKRNRSKQIKVTVTRADIRKGYRFNALACPVALAIRKCTRKRILRVWNKAIELDGQRISPIPLKVAKFIERFDSRKPVKPFSFLLKLP